jgi:HEAT repeat protein
MSGSQATDSIVVQLRSTDVRRRIDALLRLQDKADQAAQPEVVEAIVDNLAHPAKAVQRHAAGAMAAAGASDPAVAARLVALLDAPQARTRWAAAYALGRIDGALDMRACAALIEALSNPDGDVRWAALELLVRIGRLNRDEMRNRLLALGQSPDVTGCKMALYGLRDLGICDATVLASARAACASPDSHVRLAALSFLKQAGAGGREAAPSVAECLETVRDPGVRRAAAFTLGYLDDRSERVLRALRQAADAGDAALSKAARQSLARLKEER